MGAGPRAQGQLPPLPLLAPPMNIIYPWAVWPNDLTQINNDNDFLNQVEERSPQQEQDE